MNPAVDSVLVIGFGGPTGPDEIRPFLQNVARGRNVPPERLEAVARHYEAIGGRSPYNDLTLAQCRSLRAELERQGLPLPVEVGMRNAPPFMAAALTGLRDRGCRHAAGLIMAPHRCQASWERYQLDVERARDEAGGGPLVSYPPPWHAHPLFAGAMADRLGQASGYSPGEWPASTRLVFTAHSIPLSMAADSQYAEEIRESGAAIAAAVQVDPWSVAYQSASGDGRVPWLGPDVGDVIAGLAGSGVAEVVLAPVGFLCDHVEVLYDLDVEGQERAARAGVRLVRAGTAGTHPLFIRLLAELVRDVAGCAGAAGDR